MSLFNKKKKITTIDEKCFNCGKKLKKGHYMVTNKRYCCDKCCSDKSKKKETCEFC